jgi:ApaG protein
MSKFSAVTKGISVSVEVVFEAEHSNSDISKYVFSYKVTIINNSDFPIQLLRRHWIIYESNGTKKEVEGAGVVGEQPIIYPNDSFQYTSWCPIQESIGYMEGSYMMKNELTGDFFEVEIPRFHLIEPKLLN